MRDNQWLLRQFFLHQIEKKTLGFVFSLLFYAKLPQMHDIDNAFTYYMTDTTQTERTRPCQMSHTHGFVRSRTR